MIGLSQINSHPASQYAARCLARLGAGVDPSRPLLLQLLLAWLERLPADAHDRNPGLDRLQQLAVDLLSRPAPLAVAMLTADAPTYQEQPDSWPALSGLLDSLLADLRQAKTIRDAGADLAENLSLNQAALA